MIIAKQNLILFGKLIYADEKIDNNFYGKIKSRDEILKKLEEKKYKYEIVEEKKENVK